MSAAEASRREENYAHIMAMLGMISCS
jgi:hypothetical protein